jgi:Ca2+-binding RTX toxin-like protein
VVDPNGVDANSFINHAKHSHVVPRGSRHFDLKDNMHDIVLHGTGSGLQYVHGFPIRGSVTDLSLEHNNNELLDVHFAPALNVSVLTNPSSFVNYFASSRYVFTGNDGNDKFKGGHSADRISGGDGNDNLDGNIGNDRVLGGAGDDILNGGRGNDTVVGGLGTDSLSGGKNADKFEFNNITESVVGAGHDTIINFHHDQHDRINLSGIDANTVLDGDQAFIYVGGLPFTGLVAGELRYENGLLQGDVDGDGAADFEVALQNVTSLVNGDFIL